MNLENYDEIYDHASDLSQSAAWYNKLNLKTGWVLINSRIHLLRTATIPIWSFYDGGWKKSVLKKLWLAWMGGRFLELQVEYEVNGFGIRW